MKKLFGILFALIIMLVCIVVVGAEEKNYNEVAAIEDLVACLESDGDMDIIVTRDIIYTCQVSDVGDYWITVGKGKKTLNLNGKSVELNAETGVETTMIRVPKGAELTIKDTSGDNSGTLFCYGKMTSPRDEDGVIRYFNDAVKYRNVLEIDGGIVNVNGGTLEAGRSKKMWIYDGRDVYDLRHLLDYALQFGVLGVAIGARYDGYAWQQVNGDCITVNDGTLMINDGIFLGRGFSHIETFVEEGDNDVDVSYSRAACLRLLGGNTIINGGAFHGKGNADVFGTSQDAKISVKNGTFSTNHLRVLSVPTLNLTQNGYWYPYVIGHEQRYGYQYHPASDVGSIKLTADMFDPERNTVELNGKVLPVGEWSPQTLGNTGSIGSSTIVVTHHMSSADRRGYMSGRDTRKEIERLNIDGTNAYGMVLSPDVLSCKAEGVSGISVEWYHNDEPAGDDTVMFAGKYQAKVTVRLEKDYAFSDKPNFTVMGDKVSEFEISSSKRVAVLWSKVYELECNHSYNEDASLKFDAEKHFIFCTACENNITEEKHIFYDAETQDGFITYACRTCDYSYQIADDGKIKIPYLNVAIPVAETGKAPDYSGTVGEDGVNFASGGDEYTKNGIRWEKAGIKAGISENELFAGDMWYRAMIYLTVDENYALHKNHEGAYDALVYVNGEEAKYEVNGNTVTVFYETTTDKVVVDSVNIFGIDFPQIGEKPDYSAESEMPHYYGAKDDYGAVTWYEDGQYMDRNDTFKGGKTYTVEAYVDCVSVGWDYVAAFGETLSATVDGFTVDASGIERLNDTTVKISYTFQKLDKESPFTDVSTSDYFFDAVMWAKDTGLTVGTTEATFSPYDTCTRAQSITFLHRAAGSPAPKNKTNPFTDVKKTDYFYEAVLWGVEEGIVVGTSATTFTPNQTCSSAHVMTMLFRAMKVGTNGWYEEARDWAKSEGLLDGTSFVISPDEPCPRAGIVYFLYKFYKK